MGRMARLYPLYNTRNHQPNLYILFRRPRHVLCINISGMGAFLFLLEFTVFAKCIRGTDRIIAISQNLTLKTIIYSVFALVMWLSLTHSATALIVVAILETFAALFYGTLKLITRFCIV